MNSHNLRVEHPRPQITRIPAVWLTAPGVSRLFREKEVGAEGGEVSVRTTTVEETVHRSLVTQKNKQNPTHKYKNLTSSLLGKEKRNLSSFAK